ncbi:MAG: D-hexose-6-phosphate mutarotase [Zoogloeaceae bacterium]|nr:D-hexose-6-phosphate mutarotase [Zoogloeaceae bacterium]
MPPAIESIDHQGLPALRLTTSGGARALISFFGGQVLSWVPAAGHEWLYLSDRARLDGQQAIRGGIPICFPQFAERGPLAKHGYARLVEWTLADQQAGRDFAQVTLTRDWRAESPWTAPCQTEITVSLADDRLDVELEVANQGDAPLTLTLALHTYLQVDEVEEMRLHGLYGGDYEDATQSGEVRRETGDVLMVDREVDRLYRSVQGPLLLRDGDRALGIHGEGFPDVVVWNPWEVKCAALTDMPPDGFRHMLCVEAAHAATPLAIDAGEIWWGRQTLLALR